MNTLETLQQSAPQFPLGAKPESRLTAEQTRKLRALEDYDLWFIRDYLSKVEDLTSERLEQAMFEFKRFFALKTLGYENLRMFSTDVDKIWHTFLLFTREYFSFCQSAVGEFVHHKPPTKTDFFLPLQAATDFVTAYSTVFGKIPEIWEFQPDQLTFSAQCGQGPTIKC